MKDLPTIGDLIQPQQQAQIDASATRSRPQSMLDRALEAWNAGHQTVPDMAIALSTDQHRVPESEAYRLICQLGQKGLITRKTRKRS